MGIPNTSEPPLYIFIIHHKAMDQLHSSVCDGTIGLLHAHNPPVGAKVSSQRCGTTTKKEKNPCPGVLSSMLAFGPTPYLGRYYPFYLR